VRQNKICKYKYGISKQRFYSVVDTRKHINLEKCNSNTVKVAVL